VPHRELHYVPFAALHDGRAWLVETTELAFAPSVAAWRSSRLWRPRRPPQALAAGVCGETLPHVRAELDAVAAAFGGRAVVLAGSLAAVDSVRAAVPEADVLHLACHGEFRADSPAFSSLTLGDGPLTLEDAAQWPLQGLLVTLSACDTGVSAVSPGDEVLGLLRGFLLGGAAAVLSTLWSVDDESTARLMETYYRELATGVPPPAALRSAQRRLLRDWPHPFHWAPFTLHIGG
jgi:CHAT domain-containing protein